MRETSIKRIDDLAKIKFSGILSDMENSADVHEVRGVTSLKAALLRLLPQPEVRKTAINGFTIVRRDEPSAVQRCFYKPGIVLMLQGSKRILMGSREFVYGENQCMITGLDLPSDSRTIHATWERPALAISLEIDTVLLAELASQAPICEEEPLIREGVAVTETDPAVLEAFLRLTELIEVPEQQSVLAPMIIREIHFRLLMGPLGSCLRHIFTVGSKSNRIAQSIAWLRENYSHPLDVNKLAEQVHMAQSTFHRHFKDMTAISPLQYQKKLRLFEAQRLMLTEKQDAASAGYAVGYESPTQFNREYKRMFGSPPRKDMLRRS